MSQTGIETLTEEEARALLVGWMQSKDHGQGSSYGYDLYLPSLVTVSLGNPRWGDVEPFLRRNMRALMAAGWDLCRRGLLRPGVAEYGGQGNSDGYGFTITPPGQRWIDAGAADSLLLASPAKLGRLLAQHSSRFGEAFHARAQEAILCYESTAYLACCAMCGAASESILLRCAFAFDDESRVLVEYRSASGRGRIQKKVVARLTSHESSQAEPGLSLLKYWRDDAAHGDSSVLGEGHAFSALMLLLRLATTMDDAWERFCASHSTV